jgi:hypothetical protein
MDICHEYRNLGDAIAEQIERVIDDPSEETICEQNLNALRIAEKQFLSTVEHYAMADGDDTLMLDLEPVLTIVRANLINV